MGCRVGLPRRFLNFDLEAEISGTPRGTPEGQIWQKIFFQKCDFFVFLSSLYVSLVVGMPKLLIKTSF